MAETPSRQLGGQGLVGRTIGIGQSPFLRGGQSLGRKVQAMIKSEKTPDAEPGLARVASAKHSKSGNSALPWQQAVVDEVDQGEPSLKHSSSTPTLKNSYNKDLETLQDAIQRHEQTICKMQKTVLRLEENEAQHQKNTEKYQRMLARQDQMIQNTLQRTQQLLQEQSTILQTQEIFIQRLERQRGGGLLLNMAYMMVSLYIVETPFAQYVIQLISRPLMQRTRHSRWVPHGVKVFCVLQLVTVFHALGSTFSWTERLQLGLRSFVRNFVDMTSKFLRLPSHPRNGPLNDSGFKKRLPAKSDNVQKCSK